MPRDFKRILSPTDFSPDSLRALEYARRFAELSGGQVIVPHVIHVSTEELYDEHGRWRSFQELERRAHEKLAEIRQQIFADFPRAEFLVLVGNPFEEIMRLLQERNVDLLVICTHGRSGFQHLLIGSTAEKLIRHAPCPVFVVRRGTT
jgi:nucleotide-binding universal stress UspA family protein